MRRRRGLCSGSSVLAATPSPMKPRRQQQPAPPARVPASVPAPAPSRAKPPSPLRTTQPRPPRFSPRARTRGSTDVLQSRQRNTVPRCRVCLKTVHGGYQPAPPPATVCRRQDGGSKPRETHTALPQLSFVHTTKRTRRKQVRRRHKSVAREGGSERHARGCEQLTKQRYCMWKKVVRSDGAASKTALTGGHSRS